MNTIGSVEMAGLYSSEVLSTIIWSPTFTLQRQDYLLFTYSEKETRK